MEKKLILNALKDALDIESDKYKVTIEKANSIPLEDRETYINNKLSEPIFHVLESQEEFANNKSNFIHSTNSSYNLNAHQMAPLLISKARRNGDYEKVVNWLEKVFSTSSAIGFITIALWGINLSERVKLTEEIDLVPLIDLPESKMKKNLLDYDQKMLYSYGLPVDQPGTTLTYKVMINPFISQNPDEMTLLNNPLNSYMEIEEFISEIILLLTVIGPCSPMRYITWFQYEDPDLEEVQMSAYSFPHHEILPKAFKCHENWDSNLAKQLVKSYLLLSGKTKNKVKVALRRLNLALRRQSVGDKALEVSIAIESLLADGNSENTYKIGLRSSLLLGGDIEEMIHNRAIISGTYTLRSALVHNGEANKSVKIVGESTKNSSDVVQEAAQICARIIQKIIEQKEIPNWHQYELVKNQ